MARTDDMTTILKEMMGAFPIDTKAMEDAFKQTATLNEKLAKVSLEAAEKSTEISSKWARDTFARLGDVFAVKSDPAEYFKAFGDFAAAQAELAAEYTASYVEVARKAQTETVELMMTASKTLGEDAGRVVKKATDELTQRARKAAEAGAAAANGKKAA